MEDSSSPIASQQDHLPDLLLGLHSGVTYREILASVPPRPEADVLVAIYFESLEASIRQYGSFKVDR